MAKAPKTPKLQIKTPQALIHIKHKISLLQYKYWILLLRELRRQFDAGVEADEKGFRSIPMNVIKDAFGYTPNKGQIWNDMMALKNETIAFNLLGKDGGTAQYGAGFISEWKVTNHRIEFKFPSFIEDVVRGLDAPRAIFQSLNWEIFNHFSGKYEAVIYKLCRDYRGVGRTPYMDLARFREYMGLEPNEYKEFRDLNRFVISGPAKTINSSDVSDISVEVEFERTGRKVIGLRFLVMPKAQSLIPFAEFEPHPAFAFAKVHIELPTQQKYLEMRTGEEIQLCIERANEYGEQQSRLGKSPNYGAIYRTAITEGWHGQQVEKKAQQTAATKKREATEKVAREKEAAAAAENAENAKKLENLFASFDSLPEEQQDEIREMFRTTIKDVPAIRKSFDRHGERSKVVEAAFAAFFENLRNTNAVPGQNQEKRRSVVR